jgi:hypothetical protein
MRLLALLFALLSMPVLAAAASWPDAEPAGGEVLLAQQTQQQTPQQTQQKPSGPSGSSGQSESSGSSGSQTTPRHPGDYCTSHCRPNEIPCGRGCMSSSSSAKCQAKRTTTCAGKP